MPGPETPTARVFAALLRVAAETVHATEPPLEADVQGVEMGGGGGRGVSCVVSCILWRVDSGVCDGYQECGQHDSLQLLDSADEELQILFTVDVQ